MDFDPLIEGDLPPRAEAVIFPWKWPSHLICTVSLRLTDIKGTIEVRARSKALFFTRCRIVSCGRAAEVGRS
jgi:hypothetical protein